MNKIPPPRQQSADNQLYKKKVRNSNLELYRIIVMLLIVAHHYVVNSGLIQSIEQSPLTVTSGAMVLFGGWGKIGINCFVLITGYFMCKSRFTWQKLLKLYLQIIFYALIIYGIFCIAGQDTFSLKSLALKIFPIKNISVGFTSAFLMFYLFLPFLNIFVHHIDKRMHGYLVILLVAMYSILPHLPFITFTFNYVEWFAVLYVIGSYMRFYGDELRISHRQWGWLALISVIGSSFSMVALLYLKQTGRINSFMPFYFVTDSNKFLALVTALTSFMWFKDIKMKYYPWINAIGATTFGVLLIHANSDVMRQWLWKETVDCVGHFGPSLIKTVGYAAVSVLIIFFICSFIDWLRIKLIEPRLMKAAEGLISKIAIRKLLPTP